jgi:Bacterial signalling protein N terminal repeat
VGILSYPVHKSRSASMNTLVAIPATYDYRLVSLSVVIAIFASYTALDLAGRVTATRPPEVVRLSRDEMPFPIETSNRLRCSLR